MLILLKLAKPYIFTWSFIVLGVHEYLVLTKTCLVDSGISTFGELVQSVLSADSFLRTKFITFFNWCATEWSLALDIVRRHGATWSSN